MFTITLGHCQLNLVYHDNLQLRRGCTPLVHGPPLTVSVSAVYGVKRVRVSRRSRWVHCRGNLNICRIERLDSTAYF